MKSKQTPKSFVAALCVIEALLLTAMGWGISRQLQAMNQSVDDISELKDPSPYHAALMGHLGKIRLGLQGYFRSADASLIDQVQQSRKDFEISVPEFEKQNQRLFPHNAVEEITRSFGIYQESIDHALETNTRRMANRALLDQNFARLIYLIDRDIRPLIHGEQPDSDERKDAILNVENQARAWQQNLAKEWDQPSHSGTEMTYENDSRGGTYLERYAHLELLAREKKVLKELRLIWQSLSDQGRESFALEQVVTEAETFMESQRGQVISALNKYLPAMPPAELEARKHGYVTTMRFHIGVACLMALLGLASIRVTAMGIARVSRGETLLPTRRRPAAAATSTEKEMTLQMDLKGQISHWSPAAEKFYGYTGAEMRGQSVSKLFESESEIVRLYKELVEAPQTTFETIHRAKNGQAIPVRIAFHPVTDSAGRATAIGLVCTHR